MINKWAFDQFSRYQEAARDLRAAAESQTDSAIAQNLREVAERYEELAKSMAQFG